MGKSILQSKQSKRTSLKQLQQQINRQLSFSKNLAKFVRKLKNLHPQIDSKQYLIRIHNFLVIFKKKTKGKKYIGNSYYKYSRLCKQCKNWKLASRLIQCNRCQDTYHLQCCNLGKSNSENFYCRQCLRIINEIQSSEDMTVSENDDVVQIEKCIVCEQLILDDQKQCSKCQRIYHSQCFEILAKSPPMCFICHFEIQQQIKLKTDRNQQILKNSRIKAQKLKIIQNKYYPECIDCQDDKLIDIAQSISLRSPVKLKQQQIEKYKKSLFYAIYSKNMEFTQENMYKKYNVEKLETYDLSIQTINKKDLQAYLQYKKQPIGPYQIIYIDQIGGYEVRTQKFIPKGTIICQYVGQLYSHRDIINQEFQSDSLMQVLVGSDADSTFIISPMKYTNISRFINGINNHQIQSRNKINVQSVRFSICGNPTIILYAIRDINLKQSLRYDYNAGKELFPTEDFI